MYVSQVPATVIYTVFKTVLLILFAKAIESVCSWVRRYDLARIMEQGTFSVVYTSIFSRSYRNYMSFTMVILLLLIILLQTAASFLPTIATVLMPFHVVSFTRGVEEKYFKATYETPQQSTTIPSADYSSQDDQMNHYCEAMGLCSNNKSYIADVLKLSPTMQITAVPYNFLEQKFITENVNLTTKYCLQKEAVHCPNNGRFGAPSSIYTYVRTPGIPSDVMIYYNEIDESDIGAGALVEAASMQVEYEGSTPLENGGEDIDSEPLMTMVYNPKETEILSVAHLSKILYTNGRETVILVQKVAVHNLSPSPISAVDKEAYDHVGDMSDIFNNSQTLYNLSYNFSEATRNRDVYIRTTTGGSYATYTSGDYLAVDFVHRYIYYILPDSEAILKARILFGVYIITDESLPVHDPTYHHTQYLTNHNATRFENLATSRESFEMRKPGFYDSMLDRFHERPTNDLFMYALLNGSDGNMYGTEGYQDVVADISPIFLIVLSIIILVLLVIFLTSKYVGDRLFFSSIYQAIGHIDERGQIRNIDGVIPRLELKNGVTYVGDRIIVVQDRESFLGAKRYSDE